MKAHLLSGQDSLLKVPEWHPTQDRLLFSSKDQVFVFSCDMNYSPGYDCKGEETICKNLEQERQEQ